MEKNPSERQHINRLMSRMVNQFISNNRKDSEAIREIVLLGPVLEKEPYGQLLGFFLELLDGPPLLDIEILLGLVYLIQVAPKNYLDEDDLNRILSCLRRRFDSSQLGKDKLAHLVLAITMIFTRLVPFQTTGLSRENEFEPLQKIL